MKTGSESPHSQTGSLEGAEVGAGGGSGGWDYSQGLAEWKKGFPGVPFLPHNREPTNCLAVTREPLYESGKIKFLSHPATSGDLSGVSVPCVRQKEGDGVGKE